MHTYRHFPYVSERYKNFPSYGFILAVLAPSHRLMAIPAGLSTTWRLMTIFCRSAYYALLCHHHSTLPPMFYGMYHYPSCSKNALLSLAYSY